MSFLSHADNVSINFTGAIKAAACDISSGANQTVPLGDVSTTNFGNPGDVSQATSFSIVLDCPAGGPDKATVTFSGTAASDPTLLALDAGTGVATGVAVRINEDDGTTQVKLNTPSATTTLATGANTLKFTAQYQALVDRPQITAGVANATAQFTINYP
ncbi:fimbrial protein [Citrobacter amalonaticus]|uniref:fimbrial protein n=1 Tax=Citrobacter amalonaticus TaxID=35703 RepID=UPI00300D7FBC